MRLKPEIRRNLDRLFNTPLDRIEYDPVLKKIQMLLIDRLTINFPRIKHPKKTGKLPSTRDIHKDIFELQEVREELKKLSEQNELIQEIGTLRAARVNETRSEELIKKRERLENRIETYNGNIDLPASDSLEKMWPPSETSWKRLNQQLADLEDIDHRSLSQPEKAHKAIVRHLQSKRALRVSKKGGYARGKQKVEEGNKTKGIIGELLEQGVTDSKEISQKTGIGVRRVQQILKEMQKRRPK